ncbi:hypothetical protein [Alteromonas gilva]|uniref:Signal peptide prediction n=1 Tax=Alteromonas gilva TaxID=2987522 RepID=A0ABT5L0N5_9ALTE|nr:hypothetical protein [Alteromonas gilva]MDC8830447.1 hypothetical protein [Alteromonas gilva]
MQISLNRLTRICRGHSHNAFGDVVYFRQRLLVCYRQGTHHMSDDGCVIIAEINEQGLPERFQRLFSTEGDLRDPHFCVVGDRLYLLAHQRWSAVLGKAKTYSWFSGDGVSWSTRHDPGPDNWWLWRATTYNNQQWGLAYHRPSEQLDLFAGNLRGKMHCAKTAVLSKQQHGLGYPNESDCCFTDSGELIAVVRRDADSFSAQLGRSKPPYRHWDWQDLGCYIGAPALLCLNQNTAIIAGRHYNGKRLVTQLWQLAIHSGEISELIKLPSGGDNSYPGITRIGNQLFVAYYSSHVDNQSRMYLARLDVETEYLDVIKQG